MVHGAWCIMAHNELIVDTSAQGWQSRRRWLGRSAFQCANENMGSLCTTRTHARTNASTQARRHAFTHARTQAFAHAGTQARRQARKHARKHARTHAYSCNEKDARRYTCNESTVHLPRAALLGRPDTHHPRQCPSVLPRPQNCLPQQLRPPFSLQQLLGLPLFF